MTNDQIATEGLIILKPHEGRRYNLGSMRAVFKADEDETEEGYAVSEWWLDPNSEGPGAHRHEDNDEVFYVLEGTCSFLIGDEWVDAEKGSFLKIPAAIQHDFANRTNARAGVLNFFIPGGFERYMPSITTWFAENRGARS
jgi:mannose-6-phosphate isomerase-like protein (cupin superfamily)